jgi:hypothetical protein
VTQQLLDTLAYLSVLFHGAVLAAQATTVGGRICDLRCTTDCSQLLPKVDPLVGIHSVVAQLALVVIQTISS